MMGSKANKRAGADRRRSELGPPDGWRERRRSVERRQPEVREIPFSEWLACLRGRAMEESGQH
ncbi:MAG: hypothetical protein F9K30_00015 [Dechloromonas sp.]|nr:MAG: hypothetical protein F9K30_00015 [Dechloromonas sp.]